MGLPLKRAQETFTPFKEKNIGKSIHTYEWLQEMQDEEEEALYGKGTKEVMAFLLKETLSHLKSGVRLVMVNIWKSLVKILFLI